MTTLTCSIDGCEKPLRTKSAALCGMHYHRQYRTGVIGGAAELIRKHRSEQCHVDGCAKPDTERGLCSMHATRNRRHGDVNAVISPECRALPAGADHHNWAGSEVGYAGAHSRVKSMHGSAALHKCADCGSNASHWSYNHNDPNELIAYGLSPRGIAYSDDPQYYSPRCVPCHKAYDLGRVDSAHLAS